MSSTIPARSDVNSPALNRYAWAVVACNILVIVWGAAVRATGSGAGCGDRWPLCNGSVIQHYPTAATLIEFAHRASSGVALLAVVGLLFWTFRVTPRRHLARSASIAALVLTLNEALLGALLVLLGKVAHDQSGSRAVYLGLHLTNTLLLLAALALTAHFLSRKLGFMHGSVELRAPGIAAIGLLATLIVGVSGSLAALGDTLFPAASLRAAFLQDFSSQSSWLVRLRWMHPALSLLAGAFLLWLVYHGARTQMHRRLSLTVAVLVLVQFALGIGDIVLLTPITMQLLHLLGADLLWISLVVLLARLCLPPIGCTAGICARN
ncbi:MAG: COX15/CtaA family protein [Acidobacteriaceae bacterium]|nr:COX15/CtaA family protein [Acidobacteriaceae bacterium]